MLVNFIRVYLASKIKEDHCLGGYKLSPTQHFILQTSFCFNPCLQDKQWRCQHLRNSRNHWGEHRWKEGGHVDFRNVYFISTSCRPCLRKGTFLLETSSDWNAVGAVLYLYMFYDCKYNDCKLFWVTIKIRRVIMFLGLFVFFFLINKSENLFLCNSPKRTVLIRLVLHCGVWLSFRRHNLFNK